MATKKPQKRQQKVKRQEPEHDTPSASGRYSGAQEVREEFGDVQRFTSGREQLRRRLAEHTAESPKLSAGDVDAAWDQADIGDETVGGSNPTPDQDVVDEIGVAVGLPASPDEPLDMAERLMKRDMQRWELDPASDPDYAERERERREAESARRRQGKLPKQ